MTSQFLLYLDAPTDTHQVIATNMIMQMAPFKMLSSEVLALPPEMQGPAKDANSTIMLHNGKQILCKDKFDDLMIAMHNSELVAIPEDCWVEDPETLNDKLSLKIDVQAPPKLVSPPSGIIISDPNANKLPSH